MRTLGMLAATLTLAGCLGHDESCASRPTDPLCQAADSGVDSGPGDTGVDAHMPCGGSCTGTMPRCLTTPTEMCVECLVETDCTGGMHCDMTAHACVECLAMTDCTDAQMSRCDLATHTCNACGASSDCTHITGATICDAVSSSCVQCSAADESACGANSCDPATGMCTTTPRASVATCHACAADSECMSAMDRCVPMQFMGAAHGNYCLRPVSAGCARPLTVTTAARSSVSGAAAETYCGVDETVTTCEAVQALITDTACALPSDCGAISVDDARCETVSGVAGRCTYSCGTASQCPTGVTCGAAGYCGAP